MGNAYTRGTDPAGCEPRRAWVQAVGWRAQSVQPIDDPCVAELIRDDVWCLQEECGAPCALVSRVGETIAAVDRQGMHVQLPVSVLAGFLLLGRDCVVEGAVVGRVFQVCDLLELDGEDLQGQPFRDRWFTLMCLLDNSQASALRLAPTAWGTEAKRYVWEELRRDPRKNVVFRRLDLP